MPLQLGLARDERFLSQRLPGWQAPAEVPAGFFSVVMSINRILAAFSGTAVLGQILVLHEWLGIAIMVATNTVAIWLAGRKRATLTA